MTAEQVVTEFEALSPSEQQQVRKLTGGSLTPLPASSTANAAIWLIVVGSLSLLLVGGTVLLFLLVHWDESTEVIVPLVTGALGAIAGLLAPSPVAQATSDT